ncbi:MAG TPA: 50S ribosomal protein L25 [Phycisphaerales bacterium]|nr:50S ribosomal protein L25 [Phycisphaerales bacterium]
MHEKAPMLKASHREQHGSRYCQRLRDKGELPAVVYGRGKNPVSITLNMREAVSHFTKGEKVFRLDMPGVKDIDEGQMVLLRDLQFDYLGNNIVHVDLARVSLTDRVRTKVPVHLIGEAVGLKQAGAILMHPMNEIEIECPVQDIPEFFEVRIDELDVGHAISCADVKLGASMKLMSDKHANVAQIVIQQELKLDEAVAAAPGAAEPEVLTAKKEEGAAAGAKPAAGAAAGAKPAAGAAPAKDAKAAPKK